MGPVSRDALGRTPPFAGSLRGATLAVLAGALRRRDRAGDDNGCGKDLPPGSAPEACWATGWLVHWRDITVDVGATGPLGLPTWRRHRSQAGAARAMSPSRESSPPLHGVARAAQPLAETRVRIDQPAEIHLHLHGVSAEDAAAIVRRAIEDRPGI
jgi:hypothetical protein